MTAHDQALVAKVAEAIHGACDCTSDHPECWVGSEAEDAARAVLDVLDMPGLIRAAKAEALREFAATLDSIARICDNGYDEHSIGLLRAVRNDMRNRAAEIDPEEGDHE